jgi:hypothetical protein
MRFCLGAGLAPGGALDATVDDFFEVAGGACLRVRADDAVFGACGIGESCFNGDARLGMLLIKGCAGAGEGREFCDVVDTVAALPSVNLIGNEDFLRLASGESARSSDVFLRFNSSR